MNLNLSPSVRPGAPACLRYNLPKRQVAVGVAPEVITDQQIFTLSPQPLALKVGDFGELTATVTLNGQPKAGVRVTFTIGNANVARVLFPASITDADGRAPSRVLAERNGNTTVTAIIECNTASIAVAVIPK